MKNTLAFLAIVLVFSMSSFTNKVALPKLNQGAVVFHSNYQQDLTGYIAHNDCSGEDVVFSGTAHYMEQIIINGNKETSISHSNAHGLTATSTSGVVYNIVGVDGNDILNIHYNNGAVEYTSLSRFQYVTPGRGNNVSFTFKYHVTVNANGEVTSQLVDYEVNCQ